MKRALATAALVVAASTTGAFAWSAIRSSEPPHRERPAGALYESPPPTLSLTDTEKVMVYLEAINDQQVHDYLAAERVAVDTYLASVAPPPPPAPSAPAPLAPAQVSAQVASGARSYAWWEAIATCESGNTNAWRTGYYGLEAGSPIGGMSKADQLAWAERIYAQSGDGAWGCSPVAWSMVPGG